MINAEFLRLVIHYDPETGIFSWTGMLRKTKIGQTIGSPDKDGYLRVQIKNRTYKLHRIAWLYMTGAWPKNQIDHRDLVKSNNRWRNLREATGLQNRWNQPIFSNNKSGYKGVSWDRKLCLWRAQIQIRGRKTHLGTFCSAEGASASYANAAKKAFGEFARAS